MDLRCPFVVTVLLWSTQYCVVCKNEDTGYFWQITDIHHDSNYSQDGLAEYMCHQQPWDAKSELWTETAGAGSREHHGIFGDYSCDSPWALVRSAVRAMKMLKPDVDFILWTGDNVPHVPDSEQNRRKVFTVIKSVTDLLLETFPDTPFYPTIGNHDSWPANQVPPGDQDEYYSTMAGYSGWHNMLDRQSLEMFRKGGYYCSQNRHGLWQIGLNTLMWYQHDSLITNLTDPGEHFAWLETQLKKLHDSKAKVLLSGHVPPGYEPKGSSINWYHPAFNQRFLSLIQQYSGIIVGLIFGHEHKDNLHIVYDDRGHAILPMFMAPAVTPLNSSAFGIDANNPAIRLYKYSRTTGHILDFTQYYLNLPVANVQQRADWLVEYTPVEAYGIDDVSAASLDLLVESFKTRHSSSFQKYLYYSRVSIPTTSKCDERCKLQHICAITCIDYDLYDKCLQEESTGALGSTQNDISEQKGMTERPDVGLDAGSGGHWHPHHHHLPHHDVPDYMYYVIWTLALVVIIVFVTMVIVCCCTQGSRYLTRRRYVLIVNT